MQDHENPSPSPPTRTPWNKGKLIGAKPPLSPKHLWSIRTKLQMEGRTRDSALFNLAIDSKLRGCDVVAIRVACDSGTSAAPHTPRSQPAAASRGGANARTGGAGAFQRSISTSAVSALVPCASGEVPMSSVSTLGLPWPSGAPASSAGSNQAPVAITTTPGITPASIAAPARQAFDLFVRCDGSAGGGLKIQGGSDAVRQVLSSWHARTDGNSQVRFHGQSRRYLLVVRLSAFDPT
jgi:hypothetical protein